MVSETVSKGGSMVSIAQDVQYGFRRLRRSPGFAVTAILTLALGIGATTAIFTLTYQVILRSLPVEHPEQLYRLGRDNDCCIGGGDQQSWNLFSYDMYRTMRSGLGAKASLTAMQAGATRVSVHRRGDEAGMPLYIRHVAGNYFQFLGVQPLRGRMLAPGDNQEGAPAVAVLSYSIWQTKFNGDAGIVGDTVVMTGHPVMIVGITPKGFLGDRTMGDPPGVWIPMAQEPVFNPIRRLYKAPNGMWLHLMVRVPDAKDAPATQSAIRSMLTAWLKANPDVRSSHTDAQLERLTTDLVPAADGFDDLRDSYKNSLVTLQMLAAFVLLIACANLANLMLVRGVARRQELSIRAALGASRSRLIREMLVEAVLLGVTGGLVGLAVAYAGVKGMLLLAMQGVEVVPVSASPSLPVLGFAMGISIATGVLFGIAPAFIASRSNPADALRTNNRSTTEVPAMQRVLVVVQTALSVTLISTAGLLIMSLQRLEKQNFRIETHGRLIAFIDLPAAGYSYPQLDGLYRHMEQTFAAVPTLHDMSYATYGPMAYNRWQTGVNVAGDHPESVSEAIYDDVSPRYFDAVGTSVLEGRTFSERDSSAGRHVAVVNREFVRKVLNGRPAIGMHFGPGSDMTNEYEIVGVVDDSKYGDPSRDVGPMFFTPMAQTTTFSNEKASATIIDQSNKAAEFKHFAGNIIVRYDGDAAAAAAAVRRAINQVNPEIPITKLTTYDDQVGSYFTQQRLVVRLTATFGALALLLASIGLYGVTAYGVARRVPEIGLRMALGADRASVVRLVLRGAAMQTCAGLLLGVPLALTAGHYLQSQLYEVKGYNVSSLLWACVALALSAIVASAMPARRAASVEPMQALRAE